MDDLGQEILQAALNYTREGFTVIPLRGRGGKDAEDGKLPLVQWKRWQGKRPTEEIVKNWWQERPMANCGILTGARSGLLVLDIDTEAGKNEAGRQGIPLTAHSCTPRGGEHHIYRWDTRLDGVATTKVSILEGMDIRGEGGYFVAPPSVGMGGHRYRWNDNQEGLRIGALAPPPDWLVQLLLEQGSKKEFDVSLAASPANWFQEVYGGVGAGERHKAMIQLASYYMSRGLPEEDVYLIMEAWNERCSPPKTGAEFSYALEKFVEEYWKTGRYKSNMKSGVTEFKVQGSKDFIGEKDLKIDWLIEGLIPSETLTLLHGYSGLGKSWLTLSLAIEVGKPIGKEGLWLNRGAKKGRVLYLDEESHPKLLKYRYKKLLKGQGLTAEEVDISFMTMQGFKLDQRASVDALKGLLVELQPSLVIMDPFLALHTLNENSSSDMGKLRAIFKEIIHDCHVAFVVIDHENRPGLAEKTAAQRLRGSSEKSAVADVQLSLVELDGILTLEQAKARYGMKIQPLELKIVDTTEDTTEIQVNA